MRAGGLVILFASTLVLSAAALAQNPPPTPSPSAPAPTMPAPGAPGPAGITRDQYIQDAQERAGRAAGTRFDHMDANHDGILTPDEIKAYRAAHLRRSGSGSEQ